VSGGRLSGRTAASGNMERMVNENSRGVGDPRPGDGWASGSGAGPGGYGPYRGEGPSPSPYGGGPAHQPGPAQQRAYFT